MDRTIREATIKRSFYETQDHLRAHLTDFVVAFNFTRRFKTVKGRTPYKFFCMHWTKDARGSCSTRSISCRD